ncbi:MAG: SH3 domain-containing protein [Propioniciclava sp.]
MYEPRRISTALVDVAEPETSESPFHVAPRRAAARTSWLGHRVAPAALTVALVAGASALAINAGTLEPTTAVPAPLRAQAASRGAEERPAAEEAAPAQGKATVEAAPLAEAPLAEEGAPEGSDASAADAGDPPAPEPTEQPDEFSLGTWTDAFGKVIGTEYAQADVSVRALASKKSDKLGSLKSGAKVKVTDKEENGYRQVDFDGKLGYVLAANLGKKKPNPDVYTGSTSYTGKTVKGLKPKAMVVYNAVTAKWSFNSIGGYRASSLSNHQSGGAMDLMLTPGKDSAKGWAVAKYVAANAKKFDIDHIIFEQKIWTPYRPYWRPMSDRGGITANHMDHVHVSVKLGR